MYQQRNKIIDIQQKPVISNHITVSVVGVFILCGCIFSRFSRSYINFIFVSYISQYLCLSQNFWLFQVLESFSLEICRDRRGQLSCNLLANCVICLHYSRIRATKFTHIFYPACTLKALGLLLADSALTVVRGKAF